MSVSHSVVRSGFDLLKIMSVVTPVLHEHEFSFLNRILVVSAKRASISPVSPSSTLPLDE